MRMIELAAWSFALLTCVVAVFQWCLTLGAPWGHLTMGGKFEGALPNGLRVAAMVQSFILLGLATLVLSRSGVAFPTLADYSGQGAWIAVAVSAVALVLNSITPSRRERLLWAPVTLLMTLCALKVAIST